MHHQVIHNLEESRLFFESQLFHDVQMSGIYADSKTFADAIPNRAISEIIADYADQSFDHPQALQCFVEQHFSLPKPVSEPKVSRGTSVQDYIESLWPLLTRKSSDENAGSLLALCKDYVVPGGRFREIYYWDSYFTAVGLMKSGRAALVDNLFDNFAHLQQLIGHIPNGNRSYYNTRSQPPILALIVRLLLENNPDMDRVRTFIDALETEYAFWMRGGDTLSSVGEHKRVVRMSGGELLNRYWDDSATPRPESYKEDVDATAKMDEANKRAFYVNIRAACESGWDFSTRWLQAPDELNSIKTTQIVPVDLNCLLYALEETLCELYHIINNDIAVTLWANRALERKEAIQKYCWSKSKSAYFDYDISQQGLSDVMSLAMVLPLYVGIADDKQAELVAASLHSHFLKSGGLVTTLSTSEQQWDAPNGWAPLHWFAVEGLKRYGMDTLSDDIVIRWLSTVESYFAANGTLMEKYNVVSATQVAKGGEYDVQHGFGWTNGVTQAFYRQLSQ